MKAVSGEGVWKRHPERGRGIIHAVPSLVYGECMRRVCIDPSYTWFSIWSGVSGTGLLGIGLYGRVDQSHYVPYKKSVCQQIQRHALYQNKTKA